jgi:hypothetical protein
MSEQTIQNPSDDRVFPFATGEDANIFATFREKL